MRICTYNIQYGLGEDAVVDLDRIAADIGSVDLICLQEIEQHFPETGMVDQVATMASLFPEHHWVFGAGVDLDADFHDETGVLVHRRRRFGNMILSKHRILSSSNHLLPKHDLLDQLSLQRSALEVVIDAPSGPLRIITTHLGHASPQERSDQIVRLLDIVGPGQHRTGVWSGRSLPSHWSDVGQPPPRPCRALLLGDLNLTPDSPEYELLAGSYDQAHGRLTTNQRLVDAWSGAWDHPTCTESERGDRPERHVRLDYLLATVDVIHAIRTMSVGDEARGSDHRPVFADADL